MNKALQPQGGYRRLHTFTMSGASLGCRSTAILSNPGNTIYRTIDVEEDISKCSDEIEQWHGGC